MSEERRRFPRRVALETTDLRLVKNKGAQPKVRIERLIDFSLGGLQVELVAGEPRPRVGHLLDVELEWPDGSQRFDASVRHVSDVGDRVRIGVEFDDPDLVDKLLGTWFRQTGP